MASPFSPQTKLKLGQLENMDLPHAVHVQAEAAIIDDHARRHPDAPTRAIAAAADAPPPLEEEDASLLEEEDAPPAPAPPAPPAPRGRASTRGAAPAGGGPAARAPSSSSRSRSRDAFGPSGGRGGPRNAAKPSGQRRGASTSDKATSGQRRGASTSTSGQGGSLGAGPGEETGVPVFAWAARAVGLKASTRELELGEFDSWGGSDARKGFLSRSYGALTADQAAAKVPLDSYETVPLEPDMPAFGARFECPAGLKAALLDAKEPDAGEVRAALEKELPWLKVPAFVNLEELRFMSALRWHVELWHVTRRRWFISNRGVSWWRFEQAVKLYVSQAAFEYVQTFDHWCMTEGGAHYHTEDPGPGCCEVCEFLNKTGKKIKEGAADDDSADDMSVEGAIENLMPIDVEFNMEAPTGKNIGPLIVDHVKGWPQQRCFACGYCNTNLTWILDTFQNPLRFLKNAIMAAHAILSKFAATPSGE